MRTTAFIAVFTAASCCRPPVATPPESPAHEAPPPVEPQARAHDMSSPEGVVLAFIDASTRKDMDLLAGCFSTRSEPEFQGILDGSLGDEDLEELGAMFDGATVVSTKMGPEDVTAIVTVALEWEGRDKEEIHVHLEGSDWKITGF